MHKAILMMLLTVVSSSAMAEWVIVAKNKEETFAIYADPTTIRKAGNTVKMWGLDDHKTTWVPDDHKTTWVPDDHKTAIEELGVLSSRGKRVYDCEKKQWRILFLALYSENMGGGETVLTINSRNEWKPVPPPDSAGRAVLKFACSFRPKLPHTFPDETFS